MKNEPVPPLDLSYEPVTVLGPPGTDPSFPQLPPSTDLSWANEVIYNPWKNPPKKND